MKSWPRRREALAALLVFGGLDGYATHALADRTFFGSAGVGVYSRSFRFTDVDANTALAPLSVPAAPLVYGTLELAPTLAFPRILRPLRVGGRFDAVLPVPLRTAGARSTFEAFDARARIGYALPLFGLTLEPRLGYHLATAGSGISDPTARFPALRYDFLEAGIGARHETSSTFLEISLAYGMSVGFGPLHSARWFDHVSGVSLHASAQFGLRLGAEVGIVIGSELSQFGLDFNPLSRVMPLAERAGGATDRALLFTFGLYFARENRSFTSPPANVETFD